MRLWSRRDRVEVGKGTCWRDEQGECQLEVGRRAPGRDSLCLGRGTLEETHYGKATQSLKKNCVGI
jgi:hypothetical protein